MDVISRFSHSLGVSALGNTNIPCSCHEHRNFCDRGSPCRRCARVGLECTRSSGLVFVKPKQTRSKRMASDAVAGSRAMTSTSRKRRGPAMVVAKVKKLKAIDLDPQAGKPEPIGKPQVWCDVSYHSTQSCNAAATLTSL